jgi:ABC-type phosphate transport system permease subunit
VAAYVARERSREERIERIVAVVATLLVLALFVFSAGLGLIEGVLAYAVAGAAVWFFAQKTFWNRNAGAERTPADAAGKE